MLILPSCNNGHSGQKTGKADIPYLIDLERDISNIESVQLSTIGKKLEYIPLETDTACLLRRIENAAVSDSFIFATDGGKLFEFNKKGKFLKQIGSAGRGPGEYSRIADFIIDEKSREIFVLSSRKVLIYGYDGHFKGEFKTDFPSNQFIMRDRNSFVFHPFNLPMGTSEPVYSWYFIDRSGNVQLKLINTLKRVNKGVIVPYSPLYMFNGTPHFMEFGVDTLYDFTNLEKKPYAIFHFGTIKMPPDPTMSEVPAINGKAWVSDVRETGKSLFIKIWWDMSDSITNCIYNKASARFSVLRENGFVNDIDGGVVFWPVEIPDDNIFIGYAEAFDLIKHIKNDHTVNSKADDRGKTDQLKNIAEQLNENSNPVLIVLK
jgi:hypothetical protein